MSPPLFRLPNEVFDHIFSLILPHEVLNAALSCKSVLEVAKPHLTKYKDLSQANKVVYLGYTADVDGLISPLAYLETIVRNPSLAYYPRAIQLLEYDNEEYWDEDDERDFEKSFEGRELEKEIVRRQQVSFADLIDECPYLSTQAITFASSQILEYGDDDVVFALLLALLPSLQEVVIWQHNRSLYETASMVSSIAQASAKSPDNNHALSKLQSFRLGQRGESVENGLNAIFPFTAIPTVQQIRGINVHLETQPDAPEPFRSCDGWDARPATGVKSLVFKQSNVLPSAIPYLLEWGKFTMLSRFWYEVAGNNADIESFSPDWVVNALMMYAKETLEELYFVVRTNWEIVERWTGAVDVRAFERLKILEVESGFLYKGGEVVAEDAESLAGILPSTIERLGLMNLREVQAKVLFEGFHEERKGGKLRSLEKVVLGNLERDNTAAIEGIVRTACEDTGVVVELKDERGESPFHEEAGGLLELPAICASYPRKQD